MKNINSNTKKYSLILSVYNEEEGIEYFWLELKKELKKLSAINFELIWVNDGSKDNSLQIIDHIISTTKESNISQVRIDFSKNFGHEAAMIAGIDFAKGDAVICMDTDGQHPCKKIQDLICLHEEGSQVVLTHRMRNNGGGLVKKFSSMIFYKLINQLSSLDFEENASDFFLIDKSVANILKTEYRDQVRFIRGFVQSMGFKQSILSYEAKKRKFGESHYSIWSLVKLAFDAIFSFSSKPLRISIFTSFCFVIFTFLLGVYSIYNFFATDTIPSGYTTIILVLTASFSLLFFSLGIISLYFEKLILEIRKRPLYIINSIYKN